ncbi:TAXI family TRAP transporter solute-binding subunit, partial [Acuticoccus sp.]|uniref:TAXI family TRAP transporter solute-binding subunit n=1 Tax=Acuticoccus sp. TaxID=1904378 RepID=UPI003B526419
MHRTMSRTIAAALAALVSAAGAAQAQQPPQQITILSGPQGGSWYGMGGGLADLFADAGVRANAEVGGGISNLISVARGMGELAFSMSIVPRMGELGMEPFPEKVTGISALGRLAENKVHIVVSKDSGVTAVTDLAGQAFASQPVGNVTTEAFKAVLAANNLGEDDLEITRGGQGYGASEMKDRRIVGFTATTNPPSPAFADVAQNLDVRFLPLDEATFTAMKAENPGFTRAEIPAGSYRGQEEAVPTAGTDLILVVSQSMSEDEAYWMTKTLAE